jgi:hypothetical protein
MKDFENDVREALSTIETQPPLDPVAVVKRGKRMRTRRRVLVGVAAAATVAVIGGIAVVPKLGVSTVTSANPAASRSETAAAPASYVCPEPGVERKPEPGAVPLKEYWGNGDGKHVGATLSPATPDGEPICTGAFGSKGESIIYFQRSAEIGNNVAIWEGRRDAAGKYFGYFQGQNFDLDKVTSPALTPGFHALTGDAWDNLIFGYYVGPAAEVEFVAQGKKMDTHLQAWSKNQKVQMFWFRIPAGVDPLRIYDSIYQKPGDVKITVRDANGNSLPLGDVRIGAM